MEQKSSVDRRVINYVCPATTRMCDPQARPSRSFVDRLAVAKFFKSRVWDKVSEGNALILEIPEFPYNTL